MRWRDRKGNASYRKKNIHIVAEFSVAVMKKEIPVEILVVK